MHAVAQNQKRQSAFSTPSRPANHDRHPVLGLQSVIGNQAVMRRLHTNAEKPGKKLTAPIQTKLAVSQPGDEFEQEADNVAERVMRMPEPRLQRTCACGGACTTCQSDKPTRGSARLQTRRVGSGNLGQTEAPPSVDEVLRSSGQPLDPEVRAFMEPRFGHDFSKVRVHSNAAAEQSAKSVNALAYTVGQNIVFGAGQYAAHSDAGQSLLAHELAHTIQQQSADSRMLQRAPVPGADDLLSPGTSTTGTTVAGNPAQDAIPLDKGGTPKNPCTYTVNYAKPVEIDCDTVWKNDKTKKGPPPKDLCGKGAIFEITSVTASDPACPLEGLQVSEKVATIRDSHSCSPDGYVWPAPIPCKIGKGGKLSGCTDTLSMCGPASQLKFGGCEENVKQEILVDGNTVETHTITFELDVQGSTCTGKVTRK
jgi:hypothetical protein